MTTKAPVPVEISKAHDLNTDAGLTQALKEVVRPEYGVAAGLCHSELDRRSANATKILTWTSVAVSGAVGIFGALLGAWIGAHLN